MKTNTVYVSLADLQCWKDNIRKTHNGETIGELAASILNHGLLEPLLVRAEDYTAVIAGGRRLAALKQLAERGDIAANMDIPCVVAREGADCEELSLAENVVREAMHPIDQATAFADLVKKGTEIADIALRFGVTPAIVHKRIALATLSPKVLEAFRDGELTLAHAQAFTLVNDHAAQESVLENFDPSYEDADDIREALRDNGFVRGDDKRAKFVGLAAYAGAGGAISRDLFTEDDRGAYLHDETLLNTLAETQLAAIGKDIMEKEGWAWMESAIDYSWSKYNDYKKSHPEIRELTDAEEITRKDLQQKLADAEEADDDDLSEKIEAQLEEIEENRKTWTDRQKAKAGIVITLDGDGKPDICRGLIKPSVTKLAAKERNESTSAETGAKKKAEQEIPDIITMPASLIETLSAHRCAAIAALMAQKTNVALAFLAYEILRDQFESLWLDYNHNIKITLGSPSWPKAFEEKGTSIGYDKLKSLREEIMSILPAMVNEDSPHARGAKKIVAEQENECRLLDWLLAQDQDTLAKIIAFGVAESVNTISQDPDAKNNFGSAAMASALGLDMNEYFIPSAGNFFEKLPALQILAVLTQAGITVKDDWKKMKKADLALLAEGEIGAHNPLWLPAPIANLSAEESEATEQAA